MSERHSSPQGPLFVGDNLALDFINTRYGTGSAHRDWFGDDASVMSWLQLAHVLPEGRELAPKGLLKLALELRESASSLVESAKQDEEADVEVINQVLEAGRPAKELFWDSASKAFKVLTQRRQDEAANLLEPIAQALVDLLTKTELSLVRQCEAHDCTLIFQDLTKSHRRRWCSMAVCGNRMKVAAFRSRKKAD
jgi:predicted RNA-binding Zn ribbon-like protein